MTQSTSELQGDLKDESIEIGNKNYSKLSNSLEKEGYKEGITEGQGSIFQTSFDNGYEDGFRMGYCLSLKKQDPEASQGKCCLCSDKSLFSMPETQIRKIFKEEYEKQATN